MPSGLWVLLGVLLLLVLGSKEERVREREKERRRIAERAVRAAMKQGIGKKDGV